MPDEVLTEVRGHVMVVTINRPTAKNAIDSAVADGLVGALAELDNNGNLFVGVIAGAGGVFSSGMDLKAFSAAGVPRGLDTVFRQGSRKPLVAAIEGFALAGGLEIALICDLIVAARGAKLGIPETRVGLFAAGGGVFRLARRLPYGVAMEMALTAAPITAEEAYQHGLVNAVTERGHALSAAIKLAERIAGNAPLAVAASKELIRESLGCNESEAWDLQAPHMRTVFRSGDAKEGPRAFAEKRDPRWAGT